MKYTIEIRETLSRLVQVDAPSQKEAIDLIDTQYKKSQIVLGADDFVNVEFIPHKKIPDSNSTNSPA